MKKALIMYWHGLGDLILLTPYLRYLYQQGYETDLMCRKEAISSHLLDYCPYIGTLIEIPNPWRSEEGKLQRRFSPGFKKQQEENFKRFNTLRKKYDWSGIAPHDSKKYRGHKIDMTGKELGLEIENQDLEIFIPEEAKAKAEKFYSRGNEYVFYHPRAEYHSVHSWDAREWIRKNLPSLSIVYSTPLPYLYSDINVSFEIMRKATRIVLVSSVFVHACDAMGVSIDAVNYGIPNRKAWPKDMSIIKHIRERGRWIK